MNPLAFMNAFSTPQAVGQFSQQAVMTGIGGGYGLESTDGDFIGPMKGVADPCMDYKEYVMTQYLDPTLQGHVGVVGSAKDSKGEVILSSGQLSTVPQNSSEFLLLRQGLGVAKSAGNLFSGGPSGNEAAASGNDHPFMHQLQTAADLRSFRYNDS